MTYTNALKSKIIDIIGENTQIAAYKVKICRSDRLVHEIMTSLGYRLDDNLRFYCRDKPKKGKHITQIEQIAHHLQTRSITKAQAYELYRCKSLWHCIRSLRQKGLDIVCTDGVYQLNKVSK